MAAVTRERIILVRTHVAEAVLRTSEDSVLPGAEQDRLLVQACGESCELLRDWLTGPGWAGMHPGASARMRAADVVAAREDFTSFLDETLADAVTRAGLAGEVASKLVDAAREAITKMTGLHFRLSQLELFDEADFRLRDLRDEVCALTADLRTDISLTAAKAARRRRAWAALKRTLAVLPTLTLALGGASPAQMHADLSAWAHDAVRVVSTYLIAEQVQPHLQIEPPEISGPKIHGP